MKPIEIAHDIRARKTDAGTWQIKHPGRDGRMTNWYSTGVGGTERDLRRHVKEADLEGVIALGKRNALTEKTLSQFRHGAPKRITLSGVREEWRAFMEKVGKAPRTIDACMGNFDVWVREMGLGQKNPMDVGIDDIFPFINPDSPIKIKTREMRLFALRSLFQYLCANNYCAGNPAAIVKVRRDRRIVGHAQQETKHIRPFTAGEYHALVTHFANQIRHIEKLFREDRRDPKIHKPASRLDWMRFFKFATVFSWEIGLRLGDICQLEWACFSNPGEIVVHTDKRDVRIAVPMSDPMRDELSQLEGHDLDYLFPKQRELILSRNRAQPSEYFRKELRAVGIEGKSFHALRHTCVRRIKKELEQSGENLSFQEILRRIGRVVAHSHQDSTKLYL